MRLLLIAAAVALGPVASARADLYTFTRIADTNAAGGFGLSTPSINDGGTVAFVSTVPSMPGLYVGDGGPLTPINTTSSFIFDYGPGTGHVSINSSGRVAAAIRPSGASSYALVSGTGGPWTTIVTGDAPLVGSPGAIGAPSMADDGTVAFAAYHVGGVGVGSGVFTGSGGPLTPIATNGSATGVMNDPFISKNGSYLAYQPPDGGYDTIRVLHDGSSTIALTSPASFNGFRNFAVNNHGVVIGATNPGIGSVLMIGDGATTLLSISSLTTPFTIFGSTAINDSNAFAFQATGGDFSGIFNGTDLTSKVIMTGDPLDGSIVTALAFGNEGLNNRGQVAFWARLADGRQGVYVANGVVPEPSTAVLLSLGAAGLFLRPALCKVRRHVPVWWKP